MDISEYLPTGRDHALHWTELCESLHIPSKRAFDHLIEDARKQGTVILTNGKGGYYLPTTDTTEGVAEVEQFIRTNEKKAKSLFVTMRSAKNLLKKVEADHTLKEFEKIMEHRTE